MKKIIKISTFLFILSFLFVISADIFICKDEVASSDCCVQCCPSHNLASPIVNKVQILSSTQSTRFFIENLNPTLEIYPNAINRPPIV